MGMTEKNLTAIIPDQLAGKRLDQVLAELFPDYSRTRLKNWLLGGQIRVDGKSLKPREKVAGNETVQLSVVLPDEEASTPEPIQLDIVFEDEAVMVINKPVGLVVHPAVGNRKGTLVNGLLYHNEALAKVPRAGVVHRLDKDTSGLMVVAKTIEAHKMLVDQLQARSVHREYRCVVQGPITAGATINLPIGRHPVDRKRMAVVNNGKEAITHYRLLEKFTAYTYLTVKLETGRTHQIRVHMSHIKHPIVGDQSYGGRLRMPKASDALKLMIKTFPRQALHAFKLEFLHPETAEIVSFETDIPADMEKLLSALRENEKA